MNKLVYIYVPNEFVIGQVVLKSFIKRLAVAMVTKTVVPCELSTEDSGSTQRPSQGLGHIIYTWDWHDLLFNSRNDQEKWFQ
jgi:hypothetical protein